MFILISYLIWCYKVGWKSSTVWHSDAEIEHQHDLVSTTEIFIIPSLHLSTSTTTPTVQQSFFHFHPKFCFLFHILMELKLQGKIIIIFVPVLVMIKSKSFVNVLDFNLSQTSRIAKIWCEGNSREMIIQRGMLIELRSSKTLLDL